MLSQSNDQTSETSRAEKLGRRRRTHAGTIDMIGAVMPFARNAEIYGENDRVEYLYRVLKGSVRTCKVLRDGRRQIAGFLSAG